jgi:ribosomal protein S27E
MAKITCPRCETKVSTSGGWASAAVSATIAAPAVPDMATQVRCPNCHYVFAESEVRHNLPPHVRARHVALALACLALLGWWIL